MRHCNLCNEEMERRLYNAGGPGIWSQRSVYLCPKCDSPGITVVPPQPESD